MKEYHTEIVIAAPTERVWDALVDFSSYPDWNPLVTWLNGEFRKDGKIQMYIAPLQQSFEATLNRLEEGRAFSWIGIKVARWIISGEHYYRLESLDDGSTRLLHGEYFRGIGSAFIGRNLLASMESAFNAHNQALKERVEHG
jgi:hypothetical protein